MNYEGLFSPRNRMRFHFASQKVGRLLLPYLMTLLLVGAVLIHGQWKLRLVMPQLAFWLLALLDPLFKSGTALKKLTALPRAFGVLMSAALFAVQILWRPPKSLWVETRGNTPR
jgi:hypothetical protein